MPAGIPPAVDPKLYAIAEEFMRYSYDLLGAYLDALAGIRRVRAELIRYQNDTITRLKQSDPDKASEEFMDQQPMSHEFGADHRGTPKLLHRTTQGEFKQRTTSTGLDTRLLGYMAITLLYGSWEDMFREKLAFAIGHPHKNDLKADLFGDLGSLRHAIIHNHGVATERVEAAKDLRWFCRGQTIFLSAEHVDQLFDQIDAYVTQLCGIRIHEPPTA